VRGGKQSEPVSDEVNDVVGGMVAMAVVNRQGLFTYVSDRWCALLGWPYRDVLGRHWLSLVHPDDLESAKEAAREAMVTAGKARFEARVLSADGTKITWLESHVAPLAARPEGVIGWLVVGHDLTAHMLAAEALARSEQRLQMIFDSSSDVVTILEPDGQWRSTSSGIHRLLGDEGKKGSQSDLWKAVHPDDHAEAQQILRRLVSQDDPEAFNRLYEFRVLTADNSVKWVETAVANLVDEPAVRGLVMHTRDVTERHDAAEELRSLARRLNTLVSNLPVGVIMTDEQERISFINRAAADLLGLQGDLESIMRSERGSISAQMRKHYSHFDQEYLARVKEVRAARLPVTDEKVEYPEGRTLARSFVPIFNGEVYQGALWLFQDLSDQVAMEREREFLLEMEKQQNVRLTELDKLKTQLVASVSHELRTPLTSIVSFTRLLSDGLGSDPMEDQEEFLGVIERNTGRLIRLVDDLLLLDRLESNAEQITTEEMDVPALVQLAISSIRPVADEKGVSLDWRLTPGLTLTGDVGRIGQLIDNLLANAVKFTPSGGKVTVEANPIDDGWRLEVADTGIGIPEDEQALLFRRFFRARNAHGQGVSGSGLGLVIVKRVAEIHGGSVEISSVEGSGTTVTVCLYNTAETPQISPLAGGSR